MVTFNVYKSTSSGAYVEGVCLATDTKPIAGITNGSILYAVDITDGSVKRYMFNQNAAAWVEAEDPCAGGGGSGGVFWATYGTTTIDELNAAYQAGKTILLEYQNHIYYLEDRDPDMYVFHSMMNGQTSGVGITLKQILYTSTYNTWAYYEYDALAANQYAQNAGKFLAVGNDGKVVPVNAPSGGGSLIVTITPEGGAAYSSDKTIEEISAAIADGQYVRCDFAPVPGFTQCLRLSSFSEDGVAFCSSPSWDDQNHVLSYMEIDVYKDSGSTAVAVNTASIPISQLS